MSHDGRCSSASSIDSTGSISFIESAPISPEMELQRLRTEVSLLKYELLDKRTEVQESNQSTLKAQIMGEWKLAASRNVEEFLKKREGSEVDDIVFQLADIHFHFNSFFTNATVFHKIGNKQYHKKKLSFNGPQWSDGTCSTTYFTEKSMKIVDDVLAEQEISVKDGSLKIVERRGGVSCERTYKRVMEELKKKNQENDDIRKSIIGHWKFTGDPTVTRSFKVLETQILLKWSGSESYLVYDLGVRHPKHHVLFIFKENKLHGTSWFDFDDDITHCVWSVENGELVCVYDCGMRHVYRRIGEPE